MTSPVTQSSSVSGAGFANYDNALTPEAMMIYLSTRLEGLDASINEIFGRQQKSDAVKSVLSKIKTELSKLDTSDSNKNANMHSDGLFENIKGLLEELSAIDPQLAADMSSQLKDGLILNERNDDYNTAQVDATGTYLDGVIGDLDASSQMNMIHLQSQMSARQTAISLSTNLISSMGKSLDKIVNNTG